MAGYDFTTAGSYARGTAPLTVHPFTWLIAGKLGTLTGIQNTAALLCQSGSSGDTFQLRFDTADAGLFRFVAVQAGSGASAVTTNAASTGGGTFIAIARCTSAISREAILNGDLANKGTNTTSTTPASIDRLSFGRKDDSAATNQFEGVVYYSALWNTALSDSAITTLSAGAWPSDVSRSSLRCFWPHFISYGGVIRDWCGRCHLTVNSGAADTSSIRRSGPQPLVPAPVKRTRVLRTG